MKKRETLEQWKALQDNLPIVPHFKPIPYKAQGSRYGACGIRIDGNPAFVNAVLSRLKDLIVCENHVTRLELARTPVNGEQLGKTFGNADTNAEVCYIRLHMRGREGAMVSAVLNPALDDATTKFAAATAPTETKGEEPK